MLHPVETTIITMSAGDLTGAIVFAVIIGGLMFLAAKNLGEAACSAFDRYVLRRVVGCEICGVDTERDPGVCPRCQCWQHFYAEPVTPTASDDPFSIDGLVEFRQYRKALHLLIDRATADGVDSRLRHDMREAGKRRRG